MHEDGCIKGRSEDRGVGTMAKWDDVNSQEPGTTVQMGILPEERKKLLPLRWEGIKNI